MKVLCILKTNVQYTSFLGIETIYILEPLTTLYTVPFRTTPKKEPHFGQLVFCILSWSYGESL